MYFIFPVVNLVDKAIVSGKSLGWNINRFLL